MAEGRCTAAAAGSAAAEETEEGRGVSAVLHQMQARFLCAPAVALRDRHRRSSRLSAACFAAACVEAPSPGHPAVGGRVTHRQVLGCCARTPRAGATTCAHRYAGEHEEQEQQRLLPRESPRRREAVHRDAVVPTKLLASAKLPPHHDTTSSLLLLCFVRTRGAIGFGFTKVRTDCQPRRSGSQNSDRSAAAVNLRHLTAAARPAQSLLQLLPLRLRAGSVCFRGGQWPQQLHRCVPHRAPSHPPPSAPALQTAQHSQRECTGDVHAAR